MQLESHATPPRESPQQRYANLHRAIERGLDSDELWKELAEVSLAIGHGDEAVRCMKRVRGEAARQALETRLVRLGLAPLARAGRTHPRAPAASDAGTGLGANDEHALRDHVVDAFQYLFHQHMPWLVLVTTLAFPLVVGVGGFLTAGGSPLLLTAIAALPGLCVVALVGAMGRQILLASAEGNGDVPVVPNLGELIAAARQFFADAGLVLGSLLGPSLLALWLGAPLSSGLPGLAIGAFFVPMAWALRHLHADYNALSPVTLLRAVARSGFSYVGIAAVASAMFLPAAAVTWIAFGKPLWVQIAVIGPVCVLPLFLTSRLIGTWLDVKRTAISGPRPQREPKPAPAAKPAPQTNPAPRAKPVRQAKPVREPRPAREPQPVRTRPAAPAQPVAQRTRPKAPAPRLPRRPQTLEQFKAPVVNPITTLLSEVRPAPVEAPPAPRAPSRSIEGRKPSPRNSEPLPAFDATGRIVVAGADRERLGAATRRP